MSLQIKPECFAETYLLQHLGFSKVDHISPGGITSVFKQLRKAKKTPGIGIIDNDRSKPKDFSKYERIDPKTLRTIRGASISSITYFKHQSEELYLVLQQPDFENWIFGIAKNKRLLKTGGTINSVADLKKITKQNVNRITRNEEFNEILNKISNLQNSPFSEIKNFVEKIL